jgi:hypothetical protein
MIVFDLVCTNQHPFEGWFASAGEFSRQQEVGLLVCPICRDQEIRKRPSAVHINRHGAPMADPGKGDSGQISASAHVRPQDLQEVLDFLLKSTEDVGSRFPEEARRIHLGEAERRGIRGQASRAELDALGDEGIDVVALPIPAKGDWH